MKDKEANVVGLKMPDFLFHEPDSEDTANEPSGLPARRQTRADVGAWHRGSNRLPTVHTNCTKQLLLCSARLAAAGGPSEHDVRADAAQPGRPAGRADS